MRQGPKRITTHTLKHRKTEQQKISMLTCYDYPSAQMIAETDIDCVLVGDSVAMVVHGFPNTLHATLEMMELHTAAVARGLGRQLLISDLPFLSYRSGLQETILQVKRLMQAGAHAIKLEGADKDALATIQYLVQAGIPVMGHIGLIPQSVHQLGGFKMQGKQADEAAELFAQATALQQAGCFAIVLECIPAPLAQHITHSINIPTIGIGAGPHTDGQVLVWHDALGLQTECLPAFVKDFASAKPTLINGIQKYHTEVKEAIYPVSSL